MKTDKCVQYFKGVRFLKEIDADFAGTYFCGVVFICVVLVYFVVIIKYQLYYFLNALIEKFSTKQN